MSRRFGSGSSGDKLVDQETVHTNFIPSSPSSSSSSSASSSIVSAVSSSPSSSASSTVPSPTHASSTSLSVVASVTSSTASSSSSSSSSFIPKYAPASLHLETLLSPQHDHSALHRHCRCLRNRPLCTCTLSVLLVSLATLTIVALLSPSSLSHFLHRFHSRMPSVPHTLSSSFLLSSSSSSSSSSHFRSLSPPSPTDDFRLFMPAESIDFIHVSLPTSTDNNNKKEGQEDDSEEELNREEDDETLVSSQQVDDVTPYCGPVNEFSQDDDEVNNNNNGGDSSTSSSSSNSSSAFSSSFSSSSSSSLSSSALSSFASSLSHRCSGHGFCYMFRCVCDSGFQNSLCTQRCANSDTSPLCMQRQRLLTAQDPSTSSSSSFSSSSSSPSTSSSSPPSSAERRASLIARRAQVFASQNSSLSLQHQALHVAGYGWFAHWPPAPLASPFPSTSSSDSSSSSSPSSSSVDREGRRRRGSRRPPRRVLEISGGSTCVPIMISAANVQPRWLDEYVLIDDVRAELNEDPSSYSFTSESHELDRACPFTPSALLSAFPESRRPASVSLLRFHLSTLTHTWAPHSFDTIIVHDTLTMYGDDAPFYFPLLHQLLRDDGFLILYEKVRFPPPPPPSSSSSSFDEYEAEPLASGPAFLLNRFLRFFSVRYEVDASFLQRLTSSWMFSRVIPPRLCDREFAKQVVATKNMRYYCVAQRKRESVRAVVATPPDIERSINLIDESSSSSSSSLAPSSSVSTFVPHFYLNWNRGALHPWRLHVLDSIFRFHPTAVVHVFCPPNVLSPSDFAVFTQHGLNVQLHYFDINSLLSVTPAAAWSRQEFPAIQHQHAFASHKSDAFRLAIVWLYGGVYIDFDYLLLQPLNSLRNMMAQERKNGMLNGALLVGDQFHPLLQLSLIHLPALHDINVWISVGPRLQTHMLELYEMMGGGGGVCGVRHGAVCPPRRAPRTTRNALVRRKPNPAPSDRYFGDLDFAPGGNLDVLWNVYSPTQFFPTDWEKSPYLIYWMKDKINERELQDVLTNAYGYHVWTAVLGQYVDGQTNYVSPHSYLGRVIAKTCTVLCARFEQLNDYDAEWVFNNQTHKTKQVIVRKKKA